MTKAEKSLPKREISTGIRGRRDRPLPREVHAAAGMSPWPFGHQGKDERPPPCRAGMYPGGIRMALPLIKLGTGQTFLSQVVNRF